MMMSQTLYRIRNWSDVFENSQSRQYQRLTWTPLPNKHDGKSYRRLMSMADGPALYGAWVLLVQVSSKCPERGVLADQDGPLDAEDLSHKTGAPAELFARAFEVLTQPKIAWVEAVSLPADQQHANSGSTAALRNMPLQRLEQTDPSSVICLPLSEALPEKIRAKIPADWFTTTADPHKFDGADGSEPSVFDSISHTEMLSDPKAMHDWWRYQLGHPAPVLGREAVWCLVSLALGLKFANPKSTKWKSRIGVWANAIRHGYWTQAGPYIDRAEKLLRPIIFTEAK